MSNRQPGAISLRYLQFIYTKPVLIDSTYNEKA